jgi:hypothetical protein
MPTQISNRWAGVVYIEYDCGRQRVAKSFTCPFRARRFYTLKLKGGKNPQVRKS